MVLAEEEEEEGEAEVLAVEAEETLEVEATLEEASAEVVVLLVLLEDYRHRPSKIEPQGYRTRKTRILQKERTRRRTRILAVRRNPTSRTTTNPWKSKPRPSQRRPPTCTLCDSTSSRCLIIGSSRNEARLSIRRGYSIARYQILRNSNSISRFRRCTVPSASNSNNNSSSKRRCRRYNRTPILA